MGEEAEEAEMILLDPARCCLLWYGIKSTDPRGFKSTHSLYLFLNI